MTVKYLRDQRHAGTVAEIARVKFAYPNEEYTDLEAIVNLPKGTMSVCEFKGKEFFPDIVVVRRPGTWLKLMAQVETEDSLTDETALERWKPAAEVGNLLLYVPSGCVDETKALLKKHKVHVKGIRTWRFRPVWGLDVTDA